MVGKILKKLFVNIKYILYLPKNIFRFRFLITIANKIIQNHNNNNL